MDKLAKKRMNESFKVNMSYLRLVFNDFFVLALIFLFGAFMYWYAQNLMRLPDKMWFYPLILALISSLTIIPGQIVTYLKKADLQFLFIKSQSMNEYFKPLKKYSLIFPSILILLVNGILAPFALLKAGVNSVSFLCLVISLLLAKAILQKVEILSFDLSKNVKEQYFFVLAFLINILQAYFSWTSYLYLIIEFAALIFLRKVSVLDFDWEKAYQFEKNRQERIYLFYSMFTDVKELRVVFRRRKYLDGILNLQKTQDAVQFLYLRALFRNPEYIALLGRMSAFAILLAILVADVKWATGLTILVIFLTIYQLLPLKRIYRQHVMFQLLPAKKSNTQLIKVISFVVWCQILLLQVINVLIYHFSLVSFGILLGGGVLLGLYLPLKLKTK